MKILISLLDARIGLHEKCVELFGDKKIADLIYSYLCDGIEDCDIIEVVRCRDCKHYQFANERAFGMPVKYCEITGFEDVDDFDFCSHGERRDNDE